jgi:hypothetical protein
MADLRYNPHRYLTNPPPTLLEERDRLIHESNRLHTEEGDHARRRDLFRALQELKTRLLQSEPNLEQKMTDRLEHARIQLHSNQIADSREFFYALQPLKRLEALAAKIHQSL